MNASPEQQTNFQAHQRQARKNSRRLTVAFLLGIFLAACAYFAITFSLLHFTGSGQELSKKLLEILSVVETQSISEDIDEVAASTRSATIVATVVTTLFITLILFGFLFKRFQLRRYTGEDIAVNLGAQELPPQLNLSQRQYINVVEEMAIASGIECPSLYYLPNDHSINAFVAGGKAGNITITVSQGALDYLTRQELQALVAHEFGHIGNRDVFLNNRLTAILHGFATILMLLSFGRYGTNHNSNSFSVESDSRSHFFSVDDGDDDDGGGGAAIIILIWWLAMMAISWLTIGIGRLIQAAYSRQREWLADAHAVQYTRNKDALVGVLSKAMASQNSYKAPQMPADSAHFLFINYEKRWLATHPPLEKRIARYGKSVTPVDLSNIYKQMLLEKQQKEQATPPEKTTMDKAKTLLGQGGMMLGAADSHADSHADNAAQAQQVAKAAQFLPLVMLRQYQNNLIQQPVESPNEAVCAVLAQFILLSHRSLDDFAKAFKWKKPLKAKVQKHIDQLHEQHPSTHIQTFLHQLALFNEHKKKPSILKQIHVIIKADQKFELCEMSYLLCLRQAIQQQPDESERQENVKQCSEDITLLLAVAAYISSDETQVQATNYDLMKSEAMPMLSSAYTEPALDDATVKALYKAIQNIATVKSIYRKALLGAIEKNMLLDQQLSTEQNHLLFALKRTFS